MKITTWNVNSIRARLERVLDWVDRRQPDVRRLQETKVVDEAFPARAFEERGYHVETYGQKTYNGVALISRVAAGRTSSGASATTRREEQRRLISAVVDGVRVVNVYVPNGQAVDSPKYAYKLEWLARLRAFLDEHARPRRTGARDGRLQRRARRSRRARPGGVAGQGALQRARARRARPHLRAGGSPTCSASSTRRASATPGGTTARSASRATRACASTSSWAARPPSERCQRRGHRARRTEGAEAVRPCAGDGVPRRGPRLMAGLGAVACARATDSRGTRPIREWRRPREPVPCPDLPLSPTLLLLLRPRRLRRRRLRRRSQGGGARRRSRHLGVDVPGRARLGPGGPRSREPGAGARAGAARGVARGGDDRGLRPLRSTWTCGTSSRTTNPDGDGPGDAAPRGRRGLGLLRGEHRRGAEDTPGRDGGLDGLRRPPPEHPGSRSSPIWASASTPRYEGGPWWTQNFVR